MKKTARLLFILALAFSSLITLESACAQSTPKPSVPEFTVQLVDRSYDVAPTYKTDEYTGKTVVDRGGYHVENRTIEVAIKNQPFSNSSVGRTYHLFYNVRFKGHFGKDWNEVPSVVTLNNSPSNFSDCISIHSSRLLQQSSSENTTFCFSANEYPPNAQIAFQAEAVLGHDSQAWVTDDPFNWSNPAHYYPAVAFDETSGWSSTQTITIPASQVSLLEIMIVTGATIALVSVGLLIYFKKRKHQAG